MNYLLPLHSKLCLMTKKNRNYEKFKVNLRSPLRRSGAGGM